MDELFATDVWAQPALKQFFERLPEVIRLAKLSGQSKVIEKGFISIDQTIAEMDMKDIVMPFFQFIVNLTQ